MSKKPLIENTCKGIYEGDIEPIIIHILENPKIINLQSKKNNNKTLLMCTLDALQTANYPIEQLKLLKLFYTIINQKNLNLKITDNYNNNIFDLIFKYARNTDFNIGRNLFTLGENLLTLIDNKQTLKKILTKKTHKSNSIKNTKNFMQYIFPNIVEELVFEQEMEYLKSLQPRIINILSKIFQFKTQIQFILKDPIDNNNLLENPFILPEQGITMSWSSWLQILKNPQKFSTINHYKLHENMKFKENDLIHNTIIQNFLNIYKINNINEKLLLSKLKNYILLNQKSINQAINNNSPDLLLKSFLKLIDEYEDFLKFIHQNAKYKLGNEYDKNKN